MLATSSLGHFCLAAHQLNLTARWLDRVGVTDSNREAKGQPFFFCVAGSGRHKLDLAFPWLDLVGEWPGPCSKKKTKIFVVVTLQWAPPPCPTRPSSLFPFNPNVPPVKPTNRIKVYTHEPIGLVVNSS